tara:strand:+ start:353 stop:520 length:168 start_codon:yes stop_codon:yes gene_type:complete
MECYVCRAKLIWGGDHDYDNGEDDKGIVTNLSCPDCTAFVLVFQPDKKEKESNEE